MTEVLLSGCNGKMGSAIIRCSQERDDVTIKAGIDIAGGKIYDFPFYGSPVECDIKADVIIDFSNPAALSGLLEYAVSTSTPIVIATTGHNENQISLIKQTAKIIPVFFSANMSLGISLISELSKTAAKILGQSFDIEIIEAHHNQKLDAPSGTAIMLANAVSEALPYDAKYEYDRHSKREKRTKTEIGIHAVRGGTIVGEHEIIFAGHDEVIKISHSAGSKEIFAAGALNAAVFIKNKPANLYTMKDIVSGSYS